MNILVFEKFTYVTDLLIVFSKIESATWNIKTSSNSKKILSLFKNESFEYVILDMSIDDYSIIINYIKEKNKDQKIIAFGDNIECSEKEGCLFCIENYNVKRLFTPIDAKEFYKVIKYYENTICKYAVTECFKNIQEILSDIVKKYNNYIYNEEENIIEPLLESEETYIIKEMIRLKDILDTNNVEYTISNNYSFVLS